MQAPTWSYGGGVYALPVLLSLNVGFGGGASVVGNKSSLVLPAFLKVRLGRIPNVLFPPQRRRVRGDLLCAGVYALSAAEVSCFLFGSGLLEPIFVLFTSSSQI